MIYEPLHPREHFKDFIKNRSGKNRVKNNLVVKFQLLQLDYETCGPYFDEDNAVFLVYHCLELLQDGVIHGEVRWRITGVNQL